MQKKYSPVNRSAEVRKMLLFSPTMPFKEVKKRLENKGIKVSQPLVSRIKSKLKNKGQITIGEHTKLWTQEAKIRRALIESKGKKSVKEIAEETKTPMSTAGAAAVKMRREGFYIRFKGEWPIRPIPALNAEQEKLYQGSKNLVAQAVYKKSREHKFSLETKEDFNNYVQRLLPGWIVSFTEYKRPRKYPLKKWINFKVKKAVIDFIRDDIKHKLGLSILETRILGILRRKLDYGMALERAVKEINKIKTYKDYNLTLKDAKELLEAYKTFTSKVRIDNNLIKKI